MRFQRVIFVQREPFQRKRFMEGPFCIKEMFQIFPLHSNILYLSLLKRLSQNPLSYGEARPLFFMSPYSHSPLRNNELDGCQKFYQDLLEKFMEFGQKTKADFLYLTLCPFEYERTKNKGFWTYVLEIKPEESPDGLFHGILPLSAQQKERRNKHAQSKKNLFPQALLQRAA